MLDDEYSLAGEYGFTRRNRKSVKYGIWFIYVYALGKTRMFCLSYNNKRVYGPSKLPDVLENWAFLRNYRLSEL